MTTTAVTTAAGPILAIDLGKYKCVACVYRATTEPTFQAMDTSRAEVARLISRTRPAVVVIEACSLAGWSHRNWPLQGGAPRAKLFAPVSLPGGAKPPRRGGPERETVIDLLAHVDVTCARTILANGRTRLVSGSIPPTE